MKKNPFELFSTLLITLFCTALVFLCVFGLVACKEKGNLTYELSDDGTYYIVTGIGTVTDTDVVIPESYDGLPVTSIGYDAFYNCGSLISITIPNSVTSIGDFAFVDCISLTSIMIPDSVTSIGGEAFSGCSSLTSITIGSSVTSIGGYAFNGCDNLQFEIVDTNLKYLGNWLIDTVSTSFTTATLKTTTIGIADNAFEDCSNLTGITIPASVSSIVYGAFCGCSSLASIEVTEGNTTYHSEGNCLIKTESGTLIQGLYNSIIPTDGSVTGIGSGAFSGCSSLTSITIPESVTSIDFEAFNNCSSLTSITIPDSVTSIGSSVFNNCSSLTSITIPDSVTSIGSRALSGCNSLTTVTLPFLGASITDTSDTHFGYIFGASNNSSNGNYVPTSLKTVKITKATSIGLGAFCNCSSLTSITIPNSVTSIGFQAFYNCSSLTSIMIPNSVTSIGYGAFCGCCSLASIEVTEGNTKYHSEENCLIETASKTLIRGCNNSIIPTDESVTSIVEYAFNGCSSLTKITIPNSVTSIGWRAFEGCSRLSSITIPNSVTSIGSSVFYNCSSLTSITFNDATTWYRTKNSTDWNNKTSGTITDVTDESTNATYFNSTYYDYYWYKL